MAKERFQLGNVRVDTESRLGNVRVVRVGNSKIEVWGAATTITLAQDAGRVQNFTRILQRWGSRAQYGARVDLWRLGGPRVS